MPIPDISNAPLCCYRRIRLPDQWLVIHYRAPARGPSHFNRDQPVVLERRTKLKRQVVE
jgi:hypothetical protein